jgi:hypothetical protein
MWGGEKGKTFFSAYIPSWYNPFTKRAHLWKNSRSHSESTLQFIFSDHY